MKRLLFGAVLLACTVLAACAPSAGGSVTATDPLSCKVPTGATADGSSFTLTNGPTYQTLLFGAGSSEAAAPVMVDLCGPAVRVNDTRCKVLLTHVRCELGTVAAGRFKTLYSTGVTVGRVEFGRGDGQRHVVELR